MADAWDDDDDREARFSARESGIALREAEFAAREAELVAKEAAFAKARLHEPWIEELVRTGKILPAQKSGCIALFSALPDTEEYEFAAGESQSLVEFAKELLTGLPVRVDYGEFSKSQKTPANESAFAAFGADVDSGDLDIHERIIASGVDPKDGVAYQSALKKEMGGK